MDSASPVFWNLTKHGNVIFVQLHILIFTWIIEDGFSYLNHEELGEDGHGLKVDGECPEDLHDGELVAAAPDQGQEKCRANQELDPENQQELFKPVLQTLAMLPLLCYVIN